jgi:hypothetical protein
MLMNKNAHFNSLIILELAVELGQENVVLQVDCHSLEISLESMCDSRCSIGGLWHDVRELTRSFSPFKCIWARRVGPCSSVVPSTFMLLVRCYFGLAYRLSSWRL